jgi:hypothetical protein
MPKMISRTLHGGIEMDQAGAATAASVDAARREACLVSVFVFVVDPDYSVLSRVELLRGE